MRSDYRALSAWQADAALSSIAANGEWSDINYRDQRVGEWAPTSHLDRVRAMAVAYSAASGKHSRSARVRDAIIRGLHAWVNRAPRSDNWWHNTIGAPSALMPTLVLMDAELPLDLRNALLGTLTPLAAVPPDQKTAQNLIWYARQAIVKGVLTRNSAEINTGRTALQTTLVITSNEGIQADLSFHQHGNQLYSGGYGLTYLADMAGLAAWMQGTRWSLTAADLTLLADYAATGIGPLVRGDWLDWSARGREITRQESVARPAVLRDAVTKLVASLGTERHAALHALQDRLSARAAPTAPSTQAYWRSDFLAHQTSKGYFSVKMVSKRTVGTESGNGENLFGYWLPFGTTFIVGAGNGTEYLGLQPLLDWSALPGTTAPETVPNFSGYLRTPEDRVAVLSNTNHGLASMQVSTQGLSAKKFWFFDGDAMLALGTDIRYTGAQRVRTTLNQTRWVGAGTSSDGTLSPTAANQSQSGVKWLTHNGVGYVLLDGQGASLTITERRLVGSDPTTTSFGAVAATTKPEQILTLAIDHGQRPDAAGYAYAVVHGASSATQVQTAIKPKILVNTPAAQGATSADGARLAVTFHKAGQVALGNGVTLQVDHPVAVLGQSVGSQLQLQVTDLAGTGSGVTLKTIKDGQTLDQKSIKTLANTGRSRQAPASSLTLALTR
jgi:chondroitin AC lyase